MEDSYAIELRDRLLAEKDRPTPDLHASLIQEMFDHYPDNEYPASMQGRRMTDGSSREVSEVPVTEGGWRITRDYVCRSCETPALRHPETNKVFGCLVCGITPRSTGTFFKHVPTDIAKEA